MPKHNRPLVFSAFNSIAFFVLGMVLFQAGPSFNDLILISDTDVEGGSFYFLANKLGGMLGCVMAGYVFSRIRRKTLIIAVSLMLSGLFVILTPWCSHFAAMLIVHCIAATFFGSCQTTITTEEIQAWDGKSESAMQALTFAMFAGGILGPLVTEPFMAPKDAGNTCNNMSDTDYSNDTSSKSDNNNSVSSGESVAIAGVVEPAIICSNETATFNCTYHFSGALSQDLNASINEQRLGMCADTRNVESRIHYAYMITGTLTILLSIVFFLASKKFYSKKLIQGEKKKPLYTVRNLPERIHMAVTGTACVYHFFFGMALHSFEQYRFYFVTTYLDWSKKHGVYLASVNRFGTVLMKLVFILVFRYVKPYIVFVACILLGILSSALFIVGSHLDVDALVWMCTTGLVVCQSPMLSGVMGWTDGHLVKLSGKEISAFMISSYVGAMLAPLPIGLLMKHWTPMTFPYVVLFQTFVSGLVLLVMIYLLSPILNRRYGPVRSKLKREDPLSGENASESIIPPESIGEKSKDGDTEMATLS